MSANTEVETTPTSNVPRAAAFSATTQLMGRATEIALNLGVNLMLIRRLGPAGYGDFVLVITVAGLCAIASELGIPKMAVRELARDASLADRMVGATTVIRLGLAVIVAVLAQLILLALGAGPQVRLATLIATSTALGEALLSVVVVFHVSLRQQYEAVARLAATAVKSVVLVVLIRSGAGLVALVTANTASLLVAPIVAWWFASRHFNVHLAWDRPLASSLLRETVVVGPTILLGVLYLKLDALMVALFGTGSDVGVYGAAYQPIEYLFLATGIVVQVLFAILTRARIDEQSLGAVYRRCTEVLLISVLPVAVLVAGSGQPIVSILYPREFAAAAWPMVLLALALVAMSVNVWQGMVLLAIHRAGATLRYLGVGVAAKITLDTVLIPFLGPVGAAWGTLVSALLLVTMSTWAVARCGATLSTTQLVRIAIAAGASAVVLLGTRVGGVQWILASAASMLTYAVALVGARVVRAEDLRSLLRSSAPVTDLNARRQSE